MNIIRRHKNLACLEVAVFALLLLFQAASSNGQQPVAAPAPAGKTEYVGSDTCMTCHEELYKKSFEKTPHFKTTLNDGQGCESCHGPGSEHVAGGGDLNKIVRFTDLSRQQANARCLNCHGESEEHRHTSASAHAGNDVGCLDCHSPHHAKEPEHLLVKTQPTLCYGCHTAAKADFAKPYHHRVEEGLITPMRAKWRFSECMLQCARKSA